VKGLALDQPLAQALALRTHSHIVRGRPPRGAACPAGIVSLPGVSLDPGEQVVLVARSRWSPGWLRWREIDSAWQGVLAALGVESDPHPGDDTLLRASFDGLPTGVAVGVATFAGADPIVTPGGYAASFYKKVIDVAEPIPDVEILQPGKWEEGAWLWRFTHASLIAPVPCSLSSHLGFVPDEAAEAIALQLKEAP